MFDALSHLPLLPDARAHLARVAQDGVTEVLCAGTDPRLDERVPFDVDDVGARLGAGVCGVRVWRAFGVHPMHASDDARDAQLRALERRLDETRRPERAWAIGECGLDARKGQPPLDVQERTLRAQLALARARGLPVVLHLVGAWARAMDVLDELAAASDDGKALPAGGVWHAFGGPKEAIPRAEQHGLALSVGSLVLNPHARRLHDAVPCIAAEALLVETDMPHDPPVRLKDVVRQLAALLGVPEEDVAKRTAANAHRVLRLPGAA